MSSQRTLWSRIFETLSREAEGWPRNVIFLGTAVLFSLLAILTFVRDAASNNLFVLLMTIGFAVMGLAESLPQDRRRLTLWVRLLASSIFVVGSVLSMVALLGGPNLLF